MRGIIGLLFYSLVALAPILAGVVIASRFLLRRERLVGLAPLAVVIGFLAGGVVGWAFVPAQWTASFWTTVEAAGNATKYGEPFEHMAERALLYFFYSALLGAVASGLAALVVVWRVRGPAPARPLL
jgi:MFS superfamily sulfate permease-like transporter